MGRSIERSGRLPGNISFLHVHDAGLYTNFTENNRMRYISKDALLSHSSSFFPIFFDEVTKYRKAYIWIFY